MGGLELKKRERKPKCLFSFLTTKKKKRTKRKEVEGKHLLSRARFLIVKTIVMLFVLLMMIKVWGEGRREGGIATLKKHEKQKLTSSPLQPPRPRAQCPSPPPSSGTRTARRTLPTRQA